MPLLSLPGFLDFLKIYAHQFLQNGYLPLPHQGDEGLPAQGVAVLAGGGQLALSDFPPALANFRYRGSWRSTTFWVAMPAWKVLFRACPMCREPVILGGGMTMH